MTFTKNDRQSFLLKLFVVWDVTKSSRVRLAEFYHNQMHPTEARTDNSTYKKWAIQWLNEALFLARAGCSAGRRFSVSESPTSLTSKTFSAALRQHSQHQTDTEH